MQRLNPVSIRSALVVAVAASLAACGSLPHARTPLAGQRLAAAPAAPAPAASAEDEAISRNVRTQLAREVPLADIDVSTAQGKVELRGTVEDAESARRAVKGALSIQGVRGVVNDLDVAPEGAGRGAELAASAL